MLKPCANISVLPLRHVRRDFVVVEVGLDVIRHQDHDGVGSLGGIGGRHHLQARGFRLLPALAAGVQADDNVEPGIAQVQRMRVALASVADDGDRAALQRDRDCRLFRKSVSALLVMNSCRFLVWDTAALSPTRPRC